MSFAVKGNSYGLFEKQLLAPDGVLDTFTLNYRPGQTGAILVVYDGVIQEPGSAYNLTAGGKKITFTFIPDGTSTLYILYMGRELSIPTVAGNYPVHDTGIGDGLNTNFTLSVTPVEPALMVYRNGVLQSNVTEWSLSGNQVVFVTPPVLGDKLDFYIHGVERTDLITVDDGSITAAKLDLNYIFYTPGIFTFNGMNHSTPNFGVSKYLPAGSYVKVRLMFSCVFGGIPRDTVRFTLPSGYENDGSGLVTGSVTLRSPSILETGILQWGGLNSIDIRRPHGIDFTLDDEWTFEVAMDFDIL